jgi:hypothetical protein
MRIDAATTPYCALFPPPRPRTFRVAFGANSNRPPAGLGPRPHCNPAAKRAGAVWCTCADRNVDSRSDIRNKLPIDFPGQTPSMFRRYQWMILLALGSLILTGTRSGLDHGSEQRRIAQETVKSLHDTATTSREVTRLPDRPVEAPHCRSRQYHGGGELCAAWKGADAAADAVLVAEVGAGISFLALIGVVVAICKTVEANRIARASARRANRKAAEANEISQDTAKRQLRAYLGFDGGVVTKSNRRSLRDGFRTKPEIFVMVKNFGNTPAHGVYVRSIHLNERGKPVLKSHPFGIIDPQIGLNAHIRLKGSSFNSSWTIGFVIKYTDAFGEVWVKRGKYYAHNSFVEGRDAVLHMHVVANTVSERRWKTPRSLGRRSASQT